MTRFKLPYLLNIRKSKFPPHYCLHPQSLKTPKKPIPKNLPPPNLVQSKYVLSPALDPLRGERRPQRGFETQRQIICLQCHSLGEKFCSCFQL